MGGGPGWGRGATSRAFRTEATSTPERRETRRRDERTRRHGALPGRPRADAVELAGRYPQKPFRRSCRCCLVQSAEGGDARRHRCAPASSASPPAEVAAVATFCTMYKRHRVGPLPRRRLPTPACSVRDAIWGALSERLGVGPRRGHRRQPDLPRGASGAGPPAPTAGRDSRQLGSSTTWAAPARSGSSRNTAAEGLLDRGPRIGTFEGDRRSLASRRRPRPEGGD